LKKRSHIFGAWYWVLTGVFFVGALVMTWQYTPMQSAFGDAQKIFYLHLPIAIFVFIGGFILFVASAGYLWTKALWWDDLGHSAGSMTVLCCSVVLLSGMIWGKSEWGHWWTWSPRLTNSLVLWILYVCYLIVRRFIQTPERRAAICAVYGLAAYIDVPLVYVSVKLIPDIHPASIELNSAMWVTLLVWSLAVALLMAGVLAMRFMLDRRIRLIESSRLEPGIIPSHERPGSRREAS